jgi:hypothetical protein
MWSPQRPAVGSSDWLGCGFIAQNVYPTEADSAANIPQRVNAPVLERSRWRVYEPLYVPTDLVAELLDGDTSLLAVNGNANSKIHEAAKRVGGWLRGQHRLKREVKEMRKQNHLLKRETMEKL